jgi:glycosyltransferase involved in cell wall biosynthesis
VSLAPRVVFGMAAYNRADALARTIESLLAQTYRDFAVVIVDDGGAPELRAIAESYAASDPRLTYEANHERLGMIGNWRKAFQRSRALYPRAEYFAWASDHDVWHPRWLEVLVPVLDANPRIVLAHPQVLRMYSNGRRRVEGTFETVGMARPTRRLQSTLTAMIAGNTIYGLFRAAALERAGVFRPVLLPDRQVLSHLSLLGEFKQVPETLWYRDASRTFSYARQRTMLFAGRPPLHAYLPVDLQHAAILLWDLALRGRGRPGFGRLRGAAYAGALLWYGARSAAARWRVALRRTALGRRLLGRAHAWSASARIAAVPGFTA